ncbi:PREDICTED: sacsin isoform X1 [Lupinus angustifolius]|uniref:sacsin isoform X1 n=1 Tax=Lupinus angustifolius TaxID=3871 RepID=UPI00092F9E8F|nr:PREDICTED: sacsin isoform X1 [Lupinus angustifolius]
MASPAPESIFLEDFGQTVDLTRRIREVLLNYPEGTTVLKELIQNADDAGATRVSLCLDRRSHGRDSLLSDSLSQWQGPALLAFNDASFTEEDFVSISKIGGSSKQGQSWKTGRFGVGFNSVYHLTDLPSFVSGKYVVLFDPQGVYLPRVSAANPGKRIDFTSSSALSYCMDQFSPYCAFGCDMQNPFAGTLFRFPLRNADQAARSKLSRQAYSPEDISSMFVQLFEEGVLTLLFLKSVLCIEIYVWDAGEPEPKKIHSCSVSSVTDDTVCHRQALLRLSRCLNTTSEMDAFSLDFSTEAVCGVETERKTDRFYVVQTMAPASSRIGSFASTASKEYDIHLLPWASVAACISDNSLNNSVLRTGQAFCFLPLPVRTGLSVQVNGFFEVSSNRRGIWYGDDMDRSGKVRSNWNRLLLEDVVAPAFIHMLLGVKDLLGPTGIYYSLWPVGSFEEPWDLLVQPIYKNIGNAAVLHSDLDGGRWVSPSQAFLHDEKFIKSTDLGLALMQLGMPVVHLPNSLFDMLLKFNSSKVVTPATVRQFLRECETFNYLSKQYKLLLLEYCLEDLVDDDVGKEAYNLPLLPLANGDFGSFLDASKGISYFICNELEYKLLQPVSNRVIDRSIPPNILCRLSAIAKSSKTNLTLCSIHHFAQLFPGFMPSDWKYKSKVFWDPESCQKPTLSWFLIFWQYLGNQSEILQLFSDWPILPSTSGHLLRPSRQLKMINGSNLSDALHDILVKLGCNVLNPIFVIEHMDLSNYVCGGSAAGVLESIFNAFASVDVMQVSLNSLIAEERNELRRFLLDPKWYVGGSLDEFSIRFCKRLPVFQVYGSESAQDSQFSDLENPRKYLPPLDVPEFILGIEFIVRSSNLEEDILSRYYGVERMGKAQFYKQHIFSRVGELQAEVRDSIMLSVLQNLPLLSLEDISIRGLLRNLEFIPTLTGTLKCPSVLYDPRNEELYALLEDSDSFPSGAFRESEILDSLRGLGLRTSVSPDTVLESARRIEHLMHVDQQKAYSRGKVLFSYLEVNALKWLPDQVVDNKGAVNRILSQAATAFRSRNIKSDLEKFWNDLRLISWCPVLVSTPFQSLPWPVVSSSVAPPKLIRPLNDLWLVSASMRILDGECSSTALLYSLGWMSPPGGGVIAAQLLELGKNNEIVTDQVLRQELAMAMPRIYSILTGMIGSDEIEIVKAVLEGCRWIWVGDGFATSDEVVLDGPLHLAPYIRVIPVDLAVFKNMFLELGIREFLQPDDYASILCRMAARKGSSPLDTLEIRAVTLIVHHLAEVYLNERKVHIYLPDVSGRLFLARDLVYNDAPWLLGSEDPDGSFGKVPTAPWSSKSTVQKFVHGNISNDVAEKLGVCSMRRMLLAESADSMNFGLSGAAEAFGQHEALTTRLKHILEMYADGPGTLFELVQNAEDAGASEVRFLLDKSQYGTSSILSPEMADWQGPALYCFNDSVFSPQDLYAISRIGQESKLEKAFAIGRFGLGFNCVYHFTDIPMFVSGENIVMFDPHACNLPGISPSHPGLRIKFVGRQILEQFPDQFSSLLHFGCDMQHSFPGTLFRFPLRTAGVASRSQIKKEVYTPEDVGSLFAAFSEVVSETLLFLRNVKSISIYVKEGAGQEMHLLHHVHRTSIDEPETGSTEAQEMFNVFKEKRHVGMNRSQFLKKLSLSIDRNLPYKCQKILITEKSTSGHNSHFWITTECLGGGNASNGTSEASKVNCHNFVPWACVATRLNSVKLCGDLVDGSEVDGDHVASPDLFQSSSSSTHPLEIFEGRAFCFLPLPISTGLPAHVNAYFELSSNRRDIWFGSDMTGGGRKRSDWNIYLLENVVTPAYGRLLEKVALEIGLCDLFFSLWPTTLGLEPWASVVRNLYRFVAEFNIHVLYTEARGGQWISTKHAIFPDFTFPKATELTKALSGASLPVVTIPQSLLERFMEICPSLHFLTPKLLRTLLIRRKREFKDRNATILTLEYCLYDLQEPLQLDTICGLPLLPLADGSFTSIDTKGVGERVYIARGDEYGLLKDSIPHQLVDCVIPEEVHRKLCYIAQTDSTNISFLSWQLLEKLLVKLLPVEWQHVRKVSWTPGIHGQPSLEWLQLLWNYLKLYCDDLLMFSKWPILPVGDDCLMQLTPNLNVIKNDGWSEKMSSLLSKVGCLFLRHDLQLDHPQLEYFVQSPTARGVLIVFLAIAGEPQKIEGIFTDVSDGELHELRSFVLQSKWFSEEQIDDTHIDIIKHLPIFESYKSRKLVSLCKPIKWLTPTGVRDDLLNDSFIRTESEMERVIMRRYLQIKEPTKVEFYKDHIVTCISEFLSNQEVVSAIMHDVRLLIEEDIYFKSALSAIPFVLAANGTWQQPSRLYDPRVPQLKKMLHGNVFFPSDKFLDPEVLDTLVSLGVRRTLGFTGLIDCARSVSMLHDVGDTEASKHGRELLIFLDTLALKLSNTRESNNGDQQDLMAVESSSAMDDSVVYDSFPEHENSLVNDVDSFVSSLTDDMVEEEFWSELKLISWCPVISDPLVRGLPWLQPTNLVVPPTFVRPRSQMWMVSSSMHILDGKCDTTYLQTKLGWMDCPTVVVLSRQLIELSKSYHQLKIHSLLDTGFDAQLQKEIPCLYSKMQECIINIDDLNKLKAGLDGISWVWIGDDFVSPNALAFDSPVKFTPYLYVVPSELSEFKDLMIKLGVRLSFGISDYLNVLQRLQSDVHGVPLSIDQLNFVRCVLEAIAECCLEKTLFEPFESPLWIPDASGVLMHAGDVIYNDAPWLENSSLVGRHFVHPSISNDLANRLGVQSVRCLSLVSEDMTKDLPCMDYDVVNDLLALYGNNEFLLFDLLELADCCKAKKLHLIYDKREHPCQSLLQHNLGEYQGPALVVIFEGACLSQEEFSNFQLRPPWRLRGTTLNYGLGLVSCYSICDLLSVVSGGYFYMFDPRGLVLAAPSTNAPSAKMFSLIGTDLTQRFSDQFSSMLIDQNDLWSLSDSTIIRMPLSSDCLKVGSDSGSNRIKHITDIFMEHGSRALLFLKSVLQVSISTWEVGSPHPLKNFSISVDPSSSVMRNPFSEKKWRKFQLSRLFSSSNAAMKMHVIDVSLYSGGTTIIDRWLVVLSLGSGQTRNMALDRRYLAYNLTPVAGIAALISRNGHHANVFSMSSIMSPLPLSGYLNIPVTVLGCFLVCHNRGRYLFKYQDRALAEGHFDAGNQLIESWNRELMSCVCDSYVEMILEIQKLRRDVPSSIIDSSACPAITLSLKAYGDQIYTFWPRSERHVLIGELGNCDNTPSGATVVPKADWECLKERVIRPFYSRVVDLPVWQLYSGNLVKAEEGMFLSQPGNGMIGSLLPATVCSFVKEHHPVFSVPWELVTEIQAVGFPVREIRPKMVRELLKRSSKSIVLRSVDMYVDVLEYCLSDFQQTGSSSLSRDDVPTDHVSNNVLFQETDVRSTSQPDSNAHRPIGIPNQGAASSGDALEMVTSLGKALFDFGRVVVEDIGRAGAPLAYRNAVSGVSLNRDQKLIPVAAELKGLPCPTASSHLKKLGLTELWLGNKEQQSLMLPLGEKFIHPKVLDRTLLCDILSNLSLQALLKLQNFSLNLLANHMKQIFHKDWVNHVMGSNMVPWLSWEKLPSSGGQGGPSPEWIRVFWKSFRGSQELSLFSDWPLIPAFLGRPVLCRVRERHLVFIPPLQHLTLSNGSSEGESTESYVDGARVARDNTSDAELVESYISDFHRFKNEYPWLLPMLNQCNIPIFDEEFIECAASCNCFPLPGRLLGQVIVSKLVAAKQAGYFTEPTNLSSSNCDELFLLLSDEFFSNGISYAQEEIEVLRSLPIYKTVVGSYTKLQGQDQCMVPSNSFLKPYDDHCLSYATDSNESYFLRALGVVELLDQQILVRFGLPDFERKPQSEQEEILVYVYKNWHDLQSVQSVVDALKETKFVRNSDEFSTDLLKPVELFDPGDAILISIFFGERRKFPGERFSTDGWLRILRKLCLRTATEVDVIIECAKRVEFLGIECMKSGDLDDFEADTTNSSTEVSAEVWALGGSVVEFVFSNFALFFSNNFCDLLGKVAFVPAELGFPSVGSKKVLASYSEAILSKDWPLAWSCAPILSKQHIIPPEYSWPALHLRSPPAFSTVLKHLQVIGKNGGEDTLAHWPIASGMNIEECTCEILKYLGKIWDSLSSSDVAELRGVAFLPAANGTRLVTADALFARLMINLSPFAFELPAVYLPFVKILKDLGLQDTLTLSSAKDLLLNLQKACGYQHLNPNELRAVMEILNFICDQIVEGNTFDGYNWKSEAIVPDDGCRLVHSASCVYVDSYGSRYVKCIDTSRIRFVHEDLPERVCFVLGIKKLSEAVIEELDENQQLLTLGSIGYVSLATIKHRLSSRSLQSAVWAVVNSMVGYIPAFNCLSLDKVQCLLNSTAENLEFVKHLKTRFMLLPNSVDVTRAAEDLIIPEWKNESGHQTLYFMNQSRSSILVAEPPNYISVIDLIAIVVSQVLGSPIVLPIGSLLVCPEGSEIAVVNVLKLCSEKKEVEPINGSNNIVGKEILPQDARLVQFHPLRPFYSGEIVAWRSQHGEKLKYGKVPEDVRPLAGQALYRFKIEVAPGVTQVFLSSQVFSFKSVSASSPLKEALVDDSPVVGSNKPHGELPESSRRGESSSQVQPLREQSGKVSASELVQAVNEILSAVGINIDVEKQALLQRTINLQENLQESHTALLLEQEKVERATKEADTAKAAWICRICLSAEVDITLVPCGHVLCRRCSSAVSRCPFCRLQVTKAIRIYRP